MDKPLIKICGIRTPELAYATGMAGADFIGIVLHPQSRRFVDLDTARCIANATKDAGVTPVAVFVDHNALEMQSICQTTGISVIQLHGNTSKQQHTALPAGYQRIYVQTVDDHMCHSRDYLLFDNPDPGQGIPFDWEQFSYNGPYRFGIAGGLTPDNVAIAIKTFKPALIDVSSGVENHEGEKDLDLIKQFIGACHDTQ